MKVYYGTFCTVVICDVSLIEYIKQGIVIQNTCAYSYLIQYIVPHLQINVRHVMNKFSVYPVIVLFDCNGIWCIGVYIRWHNYITYIYIFMNQHNWQIRHFDYKISYISTYCGWGNFVSNAVVLKTTCLHYKNVLFSFRGFESYRN